MEFEAPLELSERGEGINKQGRVMRKVMMVQARGVGQWLAELEKGRVRRTGGRGWWRGG